MKKNFIWKMICIIIFSVGAIIASAQDQMKGEIKLFAGNFAPRGWAFCQGQLLPISQNQVLFSILGTTYGGDRRITCALPDLSGRVQVVMGQGTGLSNYTSGLKSGSEKIILRPTQIPEHTHTIENISEITLKSAHLDKTRTKVLVAGNPPGSSGLSTKIETSTTGSKQPISMVQPVLGINYIIAVTGIYPSRN